MEINLNSEENEISLYVITTCSNIQVMGIKEVILILRQILLTSSIRNVWRTVRRVCILMIRLMIMDAAADEKEEVENKG